MTESLRVFRIVMSVLLIFLPASLPDLHAAAFSDKLVYDTTLHSKFAVPVPRVGFSGSVHDARLIVCLAASEGQALRFAELDLRTKTFRELLIEVDGIDTLRGLGRVSSLAFDRKYLWLISSFRELLIFGRDADTFRHLETVHLSESYKYLGMQYGQVVAGKIYNSHPLDSPHKTIVQVFNPSRAKTRNHMFPDFDLVELSHFEPHHWIDITSTRIAVAQAVRYEVRIYDKDLKETGLLSRRPDFWRAMDVAEGRELIKDIDPAQAKARIDALSPFYDSASSVNQIRFLGDSLLAIRLRLKRGDDDFSRYVWDFWRYRELEWTLFARDLKQKNVFRNPDLVMTPANFPPIPDRNMMYFGRHHLIVLRFGSGRSPLGKTYSAFADAEDDFIARQRPSLVADVYHWDWSKR